MCGNGESNGHTVRHVRTWALNAVCGMDHTAGTLHACSRDYGAVITGGNRKVIGRR
jgi:hypothetical protein